MDDWNAIFERPRIESVQGAGFALRHGDRVRLHPLGRADIFDVALEGKCGTIEAIEQDLEERVYLAVVLDDDPGRDLGRLRQPGHCFYFGIEEVEPIDPGDEAAERC
jgi:hypothetical protein